MTICRLKIVIKCRYVRKYVAYILHILAQIINCTRGIAQLLHSSGVKCES